MDGSDALQPLAPPQAPLHRDASAPEALQTIAQGCIGQIKTCQRGLNRRSPEALHQVRVALRRWRTALTVFDELLTEDGKNLRGELDWLAGELNEARDLDVFALALEARGRSAEADKAALAGLAAALSQARSRAYERAAQAVRSDRVRRTLWEGARPIQASGLTRVDRTPRAQAVVAKALARRRRQLAQDGPRLRKLDANARHRLRIRAKKARYAAELFGELFGHRRRQRRFTQALKELQDALGELNDVHVGKSLARSLARDVSDVEAGFEAGLIAGARAGREPELLARAGEAYGRFAEVDRFW